MIYYCFSSKFIATSTAIQAQRFTTTPVRNQFRSRKLTMSCTLSLLWFSLNCDQASTLLLRQSGITTVKTRIPLLLQFKTDCGLSNYPRLITYYYSSWQLLQFGNITAKPSIPQPLRSNITTIKPSTSTVL